MDDAIARTGGVWYRGRMPYDILIRGGLLIDGSGAAPTRGDLAIRDGRIAAIGADLGGTTGAVIDASGLAVAGFDYAAAKLYLRDSDNGLVVPCDRPDLLVSAGIRLTTDAPLRARLRAAAPASLARQSWDRVVASFETDLIAVIAAHPP